MRICVVILILACLSACGTIGDESRYRFGVSADRPASGNMPTEATLAWKANQICTQGYQVLHQDTMRAEGGLQIVDDHLRCNPYSLSLDPTTYSLATMF
jgi:hypothetical protein